MSFPPLTSSGRWPLASYSRREQPWSRRRAALWWPFLVGCLIPVRLAGQDSVATAIGEILATAQAPWARWPDFAREVDEVRRLYAGSPHTLWLQGLGVSPQANGAIAALLAAGDHGLDSSDYDAELLAQVAGEAGRTPLNPVNRARFDVLLSLNLLRLLQDLRSGRLRRELLPASAPSIPPPDLVAALSEALEGDSLAGLVAAVTPQLAQYRNLQRLLRRYHQLALDSTLRAPSELRPVRVGEWFAAVAGLRRLLVALGDLSPDSATMGIYTAADSLGVRHFQTRHGLPVSGVLDSATVIQLRTPLGRRVRQIELALERLRWLPPIGPQPFVVVNIPAFRLFAFDSAGGIGAPALTMRVIVGEALDKQTPVLFEQMRSVEFRPAWNVPRSILLREILPLLRQDPAYLSRNHMELVGPRNRVVGSTVSAQLLKQLEAGELRVRQRPGGSNPLGSTKFVFPNSANVYLHGTPRAELFTRTRRDFSHGCIRLEDPTALAIWVLRDQPLWTRGQIIAAQNGPVTSRALLTRPTPVVIFYTTAVATPDGEAWFFPDIYGHDRSLDEALRAGPPSPM